ncbi:class I SAM-dependent methyltransferase [Nocardia sp. NPDC059240]|uniref:class I SAM-dependent methyltransferase n=1 Tax=Nocardia sp. NPDC059240 TaxID=3346786 RepID=UPI0036CCA0AE
MTQPRPIISSVSDAERWVAVYRAIESERADALFRDPLAGMLAGEVGRVIAAETRAVMGEHGWPIVARTRLIDDMVEAAVGAGCDRVINMAAGLDTRPYRLALPHDLLWIEADLPALLAEKNQLLEYVPPRCRLIRRAVDLADPLARRLFLDDALDGAARALVITEGLVGYLRPEEVAQLAIDFRRAEIAEWVVDILSVAIARRLERSGAGLLSRAPFTFTPADGVGFFEHHQWNVLEIESILRAASRFRRLSPMYRFLSTLPQPNPRGPGTRIPWSAVVRLTH